MDALVEKALELPAAILIRNDLHRFENPAEVAYEVGIQQPRRHLRFVNFFRHGESLTMYFKHDPAEIAELYRSFPEVIHPSEISAKHWSKFLVSPKVQALATPLLEKSYRLVCAAATKHGRKMIDESGQGQNRFLTFHQVGLELARQENVYLNYNDYEEPSVSVGIHSVTRYSWNRLSVRLPAEQKGERRWEVLEPERWEEWPCAMRTSVEE